MEVFKRASRITFKLLEGALNGLISGVFNSFGPRGVRILIEKDLHTIPSILYALSRRPNYEELGLTPEEVEKLEHMRHSLLRKTVLPIMGLARKIASQFPPEAVEQKVTAEWIYGKIKKRHPEIAEIIDEHGEKGWKWLDKEAKIIVKYLTGK